MESGKDFLSDIFYYLPPRIRAFFLKLPPNICDEITEIRLRADKPVSIVTRNGCAFITSGGRMTILRMDLYHQYGPLFAELYDRLTSGESLIYSWDSGLYLLSVLLLFLVSLLALVSPEVPGALLVPGLALALAYTNLSPLPGLMSDHPLS